MEISYLLLLFLACFFESLSIIIIFYLINYRLLNEKSAYLNVISLALIVYIKAILVFQNIINPLLGMIIIFLAVIIFLINTYQIQIKEAIKNALLIYIIMILSELLIALGSHLLGVNYRLLTPYNFIQLSLISIALNIFMAYAYSLFTHRGEIFNHQLFSKKEVLVLSLTIISAIILVYNTTHINVENIILHQLTIAFLVIFLILISLYIIFELSHKENTRLENYHLIKEMGMFKEVISNQKKLTHEINNNLIILEGLIKNNLLSEAKSLINQLVVAKSPETKGSNYLELLNLSNFVLTRELIIKKIDFQEIRVAEEIKAYFPKLKQDYYLSKIIGIIIDNINENKKRYSFLHIYLKDNTIVFEFSNDFENIFVSNPKNIKGHGQKILKGYLKKYPNIKIKKEIVDNFYVFKVILQNENN